MNTSANPAWPGEQAGTALDTVLFESSPDCVKILDVQGRLLAMNQHGQCTMEIDNFASVSGQHWHALWPQDSYTEIQAALDGARAGRVSRFSAFCPTAKGTPKWWDVTVTPIIGSNGAVDSILSVSRDITDLHRVQEEQRETAARLRFVLEAAQVGEWELDLATGAARTSAVHDRCFGYPEPLDAWSYQRLMEHVHPEDRARVADAMRNALGSLDGWHLDCRIVWPDGSVHWISSSGRVYRSASGTPSRLLGAVLDITAHKRAEAELRAAGERALASAAQAERERRRLDALLEAAPVAIFYADPNGRLVLANAATRLLWGDYPISGGVDEYGEWKGWWADGSPRHGEALAASDWPLARALRGEDVRQNVVEIEPFGEPGTRRTIVIQAAPVHASDGSIEGAVVAQMDVSDRVRAEAGLRESEAKFRTIAEAMPQMVWSTLPDGSADYYNRQWYEFTGVPDGSTDGEAWNGIFHPDDQARAWTRWAHSLATGERYEIEYRLHHHTGEYRWVLGRALPVRDEAGGIIRWMGSCTDIHEQKLVQTALQQSEETLRQADRRKDEFLAMLAHELRNPLAPISTAAELLRLSARDEKRVMQASAIITRQVRHMTELVDDLLDVSRVTRGLVTLDREIFDLRTAVRGAVEQVAPLIDGRRHTLSLRSSATPLWVNGDRTRLTQIVANLLNNAAKYTPPGGQITLDVRATDDRVQVTVQDDGNGIDGKLLPHVFALFTQAERTPDRAQGGLGIGLALVKSLTTLHGGHITAHSAGPGRGSTFILSLPATGAPANEAQCNVRGHPSADAPLHLAVVDDNVDAAQSLASLLEAHGHRVSTFHCAESALQADVCADGYILDIGLPGMTGYELAHRLRNGAGRSALIVALSGYGQPQDRALSREAGFDAHFVKPLDPVPLLAALAAHPKTAP